MAKIRTKHIDHYIDKIVILTLKNGKKLVGRLNTDSHNYRVGDYSFTISEIANVELAHVRVINNEK